MRIEKRENALKAAYWKRFEQLYPARHYFVVNVQDVRKSGYPDSVLNGFNFSSWWEFKHATPNFSSPGIQEITCQRLAKHAYCRYVLFIETEYLSPHIRIVHPDQMRGKDGKLKNIVAEREIIGHDWDALAHFMHSVHHPTGPIL